MPALAEQFWQNHIYLSIGNTFLYFRRTSHLEKVLYFTEKFANNQNICKIRSKNGSTLTQFASTSGIALAKANIPFDRQIFLYFRGTSHLEKVLRVVVKYAEN